MHVVLDPQTDQYQARVRCTEEELGDQDRLGEQAHTARPPGPTVAGDYEAYTDSDDFSSSHTEDLDEEGVALGKSSEEWEDELICHPDPPPLEIPMEVDPDTDTWLHDEPR